MCANQSCKAPAFTCHEGNHADCTEHTHRVGKAKSDCTETQTLIARNDRRQSWPATCQTSSNEVEAHLHRPVECKHVSCICCYGSNETDLSAFYEMRGRYKIVRRIYHPIIDFSCSGHGVRNVLNLLRRGTCQVNLILRAFIPASILGKAFHTCSVAHQKVFRRMTILISLAQRRPSYRGCGGGGGGLCFRRCPR